MKKRGWKQAELSRRSGVSQKSISNCLNRRHPPKLDTIDAIAKAFGLTAWHLIMPNLSEELVSGGSIEKLFTAFLASDSKGQEYTLHVAEREAGYLSNNQN